MIALLAISVPLLWLLPRRAFRRLWVARARCGSSSGLDLESQDVQAILAGTAERLTAALTAALEHPEAWPEAVTRGVTLLAWMVAHGYLDVRVAFRVHAQTGEPLPIDALDDGYVHMKWAVFADAHGNRLNAAGSLNESRATLILNAENTDVHCDLLPFEEEHAAASLYEPDLVIVSKGCGRHTHPAGGTPSCRGRPCPAHPTHRVPGRDCAGHNLLDVYARRAHSRARHRPAGGAL